jgi:hypothetical protein
MRFDWIISKKGPDALVALAMLISGEAIAPSTVTTSKTEKNTLAGR